mgnify:CR=1 FL=1
MTAVQARAIPILISAVIGLLMGGWMLLRPAAIALHAATIEEERLQAAILDSERAKASLPAQAEAVERQRTAVTEHPVSIPRRVDMSMLLARITDLAEASAVAIQQITPGEPELTDNQGEQSIRLITRGGWSETATFVHQLHQQPLAITVRSLTAYPARAENRADEITLELTLIRHYSPLTPAAGNHAPDTPEEEINQTPLPAALAQNPFQDQTLFTTQPQNASSLVYGGRIRAGNKHWALLVDATGRIHRYRIGAVLADGWRVLAVDEMAMSLQSPTGEVKKLRLRGTRREGEG